MYFIANYCIFLQFLIVLLKLLLILMLPIRLELKAYQELSDDVNINKIF